MWRHNSAHPSSFKESVKALETHIQHANSLAASLPRNACGHCIEMKLCYSPLAPLLLILIEWMDYGCLDSLPTSLGLLHVVIHEVYTDELSTVCSDERKATLKEFYAVIYPSLKQLESNLKELTTENSKKSLSSDALTRKELSDQRSKPYKDPESQRDDECGICMDSVSNVVLPNCGHSICNTCFHDWYIRSQTCPFCRSSLIRVSSGDLWVLTSEYDVVDMITLAKENVRIFYNYIENLPSLMALDPSVLLHDYMI